MKKEELLWKEQNLYDLIYIKDIIFIHFYHQWGTSCTEKLHHSLKVIQVVGLRSELQIWEIQIPAALMVKNLPANAGDIRDIGSIPRSGRSPAPHSSILAWRIPRTVEPGGLQSTGLQRVRHDWSDLAHTHDLAPQSMFLIINT